MKQQRFNITFLWYNFGRYHCCKIYQQRCFFLFKCHRIYVVPFFNFRFILLQFDNFIIGFSKGFFFSCFHFSYSIFTDIKSTKSRHKYLALRIRFFFFRFTLNRNSHPTINLICKFANTKIV